MAVCFTGHRPDKLGGYDEANPTARAVRVLLEAEVVKAYDEGEREFITGMALGVDIWAAEILLRLKATKYPDIKIIAAVPFPGQERTWPESSQTRYRAILKSVDEVVYVDTNPSYDPRKMQKRNIWMVDHADRVIAVWNGSSGGTRNCIEYAKRRGRPITYINPLE